MGTRILDHSGHCQAISAKIIPSDISASCDAAEFLRLLEPRGLFSFQVFAESPTSDVKPRIIHGTLTEHAETLAALNQRGAGVFVTVNATDGQGRKASNITRVRALWVDLDGPPLQPVMDAPLPPHIVVETSPGKYHAYWLIDYCDRDHFARIQGALVDMFHGDGQAKDIARVMRLPGYKHQKAEPFQSRLLRSEPGRYQLAEFLKAFNIRLPDRKRSPEPTRKIAAREATGMVSDLLDQIATAEQGSRNHTLNRAAFTIGRLVTSDHAPDAIADIIAAAMRAGMGHGEASYTATRSFTEGQQAGPLRHAAPPAHFPLGQPLPPDEARAALQATINDVVGQAVSWKYRTAEIDKLVTSGNTRKDARQAFVSRYGFTDSTHAPRDLIVATPGLGKTRAMIDAIVQSDLQRVFLYVPTGALGAEQVAAFPANVKAIRGRCADNCFKHELCTAAGKLSIPIHSTFCRMEIEGENKTHWDRRRPSDAADSKQKKQWDNRRAIGQQTIVTCEHYAGCRYLEQFHDTGEQIVVLSHEYLHIESPIIRDTFGKPDLHVIDEAIVGMATGHQDFPPSILPADFHGVRLGDDIRQIAIAAGWTLADVRQYRDDLFAQVLQHGREIAKGLNPSTKLADAVKRFQAMPVSTVNKQWRFFAQLARQWELPHSQAIQIIHDKDGNVKVSVSYKRDLGMLAESEPAVMLDADGDININRALVSPRMTEHRIDAARNVRVVQVATPASMQGLGVKDEEPTAKLARLARIIRAMPGQKLVVTYKGAEPLADWGCDTAHFGAILGSNQYRNHDTVVVVGRNLPTCEDVERLSRAIWSDDPQPLALSGRYEQAMQGYTMADGSLHGARVQTHPDDRVTTVLDIIRGRQTAQAVDRLRLVNNDPSTKLAVILDDTPSPLPVTDVVTEFDLLARVTIGNLLEQGQGVAIVTEVALMGAGMTEMEAKRGINSNSPSGFCPILYYYKGAPSWTFKATAQMVDISGKATLVVSTLPEQQTADSLASLIDPLQVALDRSDGGVILLSKQWLVDTFPDLFTSETTALRWIAKATPTGHVRSNTARRVTAFLASSRTHNPKATLVKMLAAKGGTIAYYSGPGADAENYDSWNMGEFTAPQPPVTAPPIQWAGGSVGVTVPLDPLVPTVPPTKPTHNPWWGQFLADRLAGATIINHQYKRDGVIVEIDHQEISIVSKSTAQNASWARLARCE
ncbi:MAG: hypothetical protein HQL58_12080 [Magnetococcales bacterium]|nr:hypothetical protein [Magnetococcales bacterium]